MTNPNNNRPAISCRRQITLNWLQEIVIGLNLCPFASPYFQRGLIDVEELSGDTEACLIALVSRLQGLQQDSDTETVLQLLPRAYDDFDEYLDFLALAEDLMQEMSFADHFQLASFHPDYCFEGLEPTDAANFTNRSPFPMLHILRETTLDKVLSQYADPAGIPQRNIDLTRKMGGEVLGRMLRECHAPSKSISGR